MTIHIPKWLAIALGVALVGAAIAGAYLLGQSNDDDGEGEGDTAVVAQGDSSTGDGNGQDSG